MEPCDYTPPPLDKVYPAHYSITLLYPSLSVDHFSIYTIMMRVVVLMMCVCVCVSVCVCACVHVCVVHVCVACMYV